MGLFQTIRNEAEARGLSFLVIGGLAVNMHGFARDTADFDMLVARDDRRKWLDFFAHLQYSIKLDMDSFIQLDPPAAGAWPVDLMLVRQPTFDSMYTTGIEVDMLGVKLLIPLLEHLLALKLHALKHGHPARYLKDFLDVENLVRINGMDMRAEKIRALFLKYGNLELYEKISEAVAR